MSPRDANTTPAGPARSTRRQPLVGRDLRTEELVFNMGPQHPATHGVLRVVVKSDGEVVRGLEPHVGNLHRSSEKIGEEIPYYQWLPYVDRWDYLAAMNNEHVACMAMERLGGLEIPERAEYIRVIVAEVQRILSHLMAIGVYGLDLGAFTPFLHQFRERERGLDLLDHISGGAAALPLHPHRRREARPLDGVDRRARGLPRRTSRSACPTTTPCCSTTTSSRSGPAASASSTARSPCAGG